MRRLKQMQVVVAGTLIVFFATWSAQSIARAQVDSSESEAPIDLTKAKRGSCKPEELQSARGCVQLPERTKNVFPAYPVRALRSRQDGSVSLSVTLDLAGKIVDVTVSGSLPKNLGFEDAAIEAVRQWQYSPALLAGEAVPVVFTVRVDFSVSR